MMWYIPYTFFLLIRIGQVITWVQNYEGREITPLLSSEIDRFTGNDSFLDYFKVLHTEDTSVLIGSRNIVYNISLFDMTEDFKKRIVWSPSGAHRELCYLKGKSEEDCHNYIRVGVKVDENQVLICGTNAYKPLCRQYKYYENNITFIPETEGQGRCPYDPNHNSTALYSDGQLYTATVADFSGVDPLIYREPLRTEWSDLKQLNDPNFVSSMSHDNYVLFFFREAAVEHINCGKVVYSRVARVCKRDKGGPHQFRDRWTSFIKARLNCSIPADYPFYFDEIQSTSDIIEGVYGTEKVQLIYGVFTTAANSIAGSAICAFRVDDIMKTFDGAFKEQATMNANWLRVPHSKVPEPRPGKCVNDSRTLPDASVNFLKTHSLMDKAVPSFSPPSLIHTNLRSRFTVIAVDPQVETVSGQKMDVLFIGTDDGRIVKAVHFAGGHFIEEIKATENNVAIQSLSITHLPNHVQKLLVVTNDIVMTVPLYHCSKKKTCRDCVQLQDPYCAWDSINGSCIAHAETKGSKAHLLQNITKISHMCQTLGYVETPLVDNAQGISVAEDKVGHSCPKCSLCPSPCPPDDEIPISKDNIYTGSSVLMAMSLSGLLALLFGFVFGYLCSKHIHFDNAYSNMPLHSHHRSNRLTDANGEGASYLSTCANNKAAINLVVNVPPKNANDKNANSSSENNKTLQKVKKTYL